MHFISGLICAFLGAIPFGVTGALIGALIGVIAFEIYSLRIRVGKFEYSIVARLAKLEARVAQEPEVKPEQTGTPFAEPTPREEEAKSVEDAEGDGIAAGPSQYEEEETEKTFGTSTDTPFVLADEETIFTRTSEKFGETGKQLKNDVVRFFTGGNLILKIGLIVLFFGLAFLIKYAAQRNMIPVEFRLIGVFISGLVLMTIGWWLRYSRPGYGLTLQGGGVAILYLVVFAAAKLFSFLPVTLSLVVMVCLVVLSCALAILQDSKSLAVLGIAGGFLAPVLMSSGGGNHVMLFSYYSLLNCGVFGIAWFKSWRILNLVGFIFTFGIATLWGGGAYRPEYFWTTEPFLILFFLLYAVIAVLFAYRQQIDLKGYIDGPLVFGLPLVVSGLQYYLVKDYPFGMAYSALALSLFYLGFVKILWRRLDSSMRMLCEAFLALGVVFCSLAVPLALDGQWASSIWALEGGGMVWVGVKQRRLLARHFGLLLQVGAAVIFLDSVWYPFKALPFMNNYFLGCSFLATAAMVSSYWYDHGRALLKKWEHNYSLPLFIVGLIWWYVGGIREADQHFMHISSSGVFLLFCSASSILIGLVGLKTKWQRLYYGLLLQLPVMVVLAAISFPDTVGGTYLFKKQGLLIWSIGFGVQYRILHSFGSSWNLSIASWYHCITMLLLVFILSNEASWGVNRFVADGPIWSQVCWVLVPSMALFLLVWLRGKRISWSGGKFEKAYLGYGSVFLAAAMTLWMAWAFTVPGNPVPLPYLPFLNPLELSVILSLCVIVNWTHKCEDLLKEKGIVDGKYFYLGVLLLGFLLLNSIVARCVHTFLAIPFYFHSLYNSVIFQASIAALWAVCALVITVFATRRANRWMWGVGAALLGLVVLKLFLVDLSGSGTIGRIVSFLVVGVLMLLVGYFSPLPPKKEEDPK